MANPFEEEMADPSKGTPTLTKQAYENLTYFDIAAKLINDNLLLTALELHTELIEAGREVPKLKEFFSNPGNFEQQASGARLETSSSIRRSSSQATLDSLDLTRYSEDGERGVDERVAVLEFELRKAKETISALRTNLTVAAESESATPEVGAAKLLSNEAIKPHEQRALNFLLNEYLLLHNYKLTSITFADENEDQDFEDWDDVGLNIPKPSELLNIYRDFLRQTGCSHSPCKHTGCQTDLSITSEDVPPQELFSHVQSTTADLTSTTNDLTSTTNDFTSTTNDLTSTTNDLTSTTNDFTSTTNDIPSTTNDLPSTVHALPCNASSLTLTAADPARPDSCLSTAPDLIHLELLEQIQVLQEQIQVLHNEKQDLQRLWTLERQQEMSSATTPGSDLGVGANNETASLRSATPERFVMVENKMADEGDGTTSLADTDTEWTRVAIPTQPGLQDEQGTDVANGSCTSRELLVPSALLNASVGRVLPAAFQQEVFARCFVNTAQARERVLLDDDITDKRLVHILGQSLPRIIPNVILNKREEVLPLVVAAIHLHPDSRERDRLLHLLFNLKKRPHEDERLVILAGLVCLARRSPLALVENEILPQCWEQVAHRHVERRLLVAESCSALAPYVSSGIRNSLMLSMLQQMLLEDKDETVRDSAVRSLSLLVALADDPDKYTQCEQLALTAALDDPSAIASSTATRLLLPVLAKWALDLHQLQPRLIAKLLDRVKSRPCERNVDALRTLVPHVVVCAVWVEAVLQGIDGRTTPRGECGMGEGLTDPAVFYEGEHQMGVVLGAFDALVAGQEWQVWPELDWLLSVFVPSLLDAVQQTDAENESVVASFVLLFRQLCSGLGAVVTRSHLTPQFLERLQHLETSLANGRGGSEAQPSLAIIPVYLVGVLASVAQDDPEDLAPMLKRFLFGLPLCGCPLTALESTVRGLCPPPPAPTTHQAAVAAALWGAVGHPRPVVRQAAAELLRAVVGLAADTVLAGQLVPALVTLATDSDMSVRTASVRAFGSLVTCTTLKEAHDKAYVQLQAFLADPVSRDHHNMLLALVNTMGSVVPSCEAWFREEVILPQLAAMAAYTLQLGNLTKRLDLANALIEAFCSAVCCPASKHSISTALLPGLRYLEPISAQSLRNHHDTVLTMIRNAESRVEGVGMSPSASTTTTSSISLAAATANVNQGVEDMKKRMANIFANKGNRPANLPNLQGIFRKK